MSLQGTVVSGRLRSDLCPWGVKWSISQTSVNRHHQFGSIKTVHKLEDFHKYNNLVGFTKFLK